MANQVQAHGFFPPMGHVVSSWLYIQTLCWYRNENASLLKITHSHKADVQHQPSFNL